MKLKKKLIEIPNFKFRKNNNFKKNLEKLEIEVLKYKINSLKKFLKIKKKNNLEKIKIENVSAKDIKEAKLDLINLIEKETNQKKIIKVLSKYNSIPKKIINYFKKNLPDEISDEMIVNKILEYLSIKYNKLSILDIDIDYIIFDKKYLLDEEGPREYIFNGLKKNNKKDFCIIS